MEDFDQDRYQDAGPSTPPLQEKTPRQKEKERKSRRSTLYELAHDPDGVERVEDNGGRVRDEMLEDHYQQEVLALTQEGKEYPEVVAARNQTK